MVPGARLAQRDNICFVKMFLNRLTFDSEAGEFFAPKMCDIDSLKHSHFNKFTL